VPARPNRVKLPDDVIRVLSAATGIDQVTLVGSRASGLAGPQSDWDFAVATAAFADMRDALPRLTAPLRPIVAQWDRLSRNWCYMLILDGPAKVDLIFDQPHTPLPPWRVSAATLRGIDDHFWDWTLWLHSKYAAGRHHVVASELGKLHEHLLGPLGVAATPAGLGQAVTAYRTARDHWERTFGMRVPRAAEHTVTRGFRPNG
jgi:Nucleotidyltransferase domain